MGAVASRQRAEEAPPRRALRGVVERITYQNPENGYTVARLAPERAAGEGEVEAARGDDRLVTLVGTLADLTPGEAIVAHGWWQNNPKHGWQFQVLDYRTSLPATTQGMRRYLGSGLVKGVGPVMAGRIVDAFGEQTFEMIDATPERLTEVPGIGKVRASRIAATWVEQRHIRAVMTALQGYGVSTSLAVRIYKRFGDDSGRVVGQEPYRLAREVWGIGFKTADKIAQAVGIAPDAPARLQAGVLHAMGAAGDAGHTLLPERELVETAAELLGVEAGRLGEPVEALLRTGDLVAARRSDTILRLVALAPFARAESGLASRLTALAESARDARVARTFAAAGWPAAFGWLAARHGSTLAPEQEAGVRMALTSPVSILTGGPGTGKTHTLRAILTLARAKRLRPLLAAPTGRAAKRLSELAGLEAATLHRLLQLRPGGDAAFDRDHSLDADLVVVDEASMLDVLLANKLIKAIPPGAHLLLVGDVDQLPSVGAGEVLRDLLAAERLPRVRLTKVFRQAQHSGVVTNAHRINAGQPPMTHGLDDFFQFPEEDAERVADLVVDIVANRLPRRFGLNPRQEVQVLCPMHRGPAGVGVLNERLQAALTPGREGLPERRFGGRIYRVGDKVMQLRNNYDKGTAGVFNGSVGVVTALSLEDSELRVLLDEDEEVPYGFDELDELIHAYAVSIHRSQGSEYPCVVVPVTTSAWLMLQRNLLYTAVTRAKRIVVLVGSRRALAKAVRTQSAGRRYTALTQRLQ
jgi:exodeoxyribonuclease V alpha subunit